MNINLDNILLMKSISWIILIEYNFDISLFLYNDLHMEFIIIYQTIRPYVNSNWPSNRTSRFRKPKNDNIWFPCTVEEE